MEGKNIIENNAKNNNITNHDFYKGKPITKCRLCIWFGTLWLATDKPREILEGIFKALDAKYVHGQYEQGSKSKDNKYSGKHLQFTVHLKKNQYLSWIKARVKLNVDWTASRSIAAEGYVSKDDTRIDGPWEFGEKPKEVVANAEKIKDKKITINQAKDMTMPQLMDHYGFLNVQKVIQSYNLLHTKFTKENIYKPRVVYYIWGDPGTGKSPMAEFILFKYFKEIQKIKFFRNSIGEGGFWGFDPEWTEQEIKVGYYDEWREEHMSLTEFLNLIDYKTTMLNIKRGRMLNDLQIIIITTTQDPENIYANVGEVKYRPVNRCQINKRLDYIIHLKEDWKYKYKKYIEAGGLNPLEKLKEMEKVDFFDDKIVSPLERENHEFDIDKVMSDGMNISQIEKEEKCEIKEESDAGLDFGQSFLEEISMLKTPALMTKSEIEKRASLKKYFIYSIKSSERESFAETMIGGDYNQIIFDGENYWGDDWSLETAVLKLDKVPPKDFQTFLYEEKPSFKTRKGMKTPDLKYLYLLSQETLINLYPELDDQKELWYRSLYVIELDMSTKRKFKTMSSALENLLNNSRKNIFNLLFK